MLRSFILIILSLLLVSCADLKRADKAYKQGDYASAVKQWETLSKLGFPQAKLKLARMYNKGTGVKKIDHKKAYSLFLEASKDEKTKSKSIFEIGKMYQRGQWLGLSVKKAESFYKKAFALGSKKAAYYLGTLYKKGGNVKAAKKWYKKAFDAGYIPKPRKSKAKSKLKTNGGNKK